MRYGGVTAALERKCGRLHPSKLPAMLKVRLFGQIVLQVDDEPIPIRVPARALALLAYLVCDRSRPHPRDAVAFAFWPDSAEAEARSKLRTHLHYVVRGLLPAPINGEPWLLTDKRSVQWNPSAPIWLDIDEFGRLAADPSSADAAIALYTGDFLAGLDERWAEAPRAHLRERAMALLQDSIERARAQGDAARAVAAAQRVLEIDPYRENAMRALITLRSESGDRAGALMTYRNFVERLKADLGAEPMPESVAAYESVATSNGAAGAPAAKRTALPTGTVTFLFTDIQGSAQRWASHRAAMPAALQRHDAILRTAIETNGGAVFKTVGDGYCAAFARAADAVAATLAVQRELSGQDFSEVEGIAVRMALHTGPAHERGGDYLGPTVDRTARILEIGHGGQVLLSIDCEVQVRDLRASGLTFVDLGLHRLRDLAAPEHLFQLGAPDLPSTFPELRSLNVLSNALSPQITPLVGRHKELVAIRSLYEEARLVTLTGAGGIGKTRVALQVAADLLDADGAWFVDLAAVDDPALVESAIAEALDVRDPGLAPSLIDATINLLRNKHALLVLDNCEHVIDAAARGADRLLRGCTVLRIIATSREPLGIAGEHVFRLPTLTVPPPDRAATAAALMEYSAAELFVSRARAAQQSFVLNDANAEFVATIVRQLDGIALAIELAAARAGAMGLAQLSRRLDQRFKLLTGGSRTALPRQQTLRDTIAWSYDLLPENERRVFRRLATFSGGFTLDLAVASFADDELEDHEVLDLLTRLVDKSLVHTEPVEGDVRYRLLESTRAYARERLIDAGEEAAATRAHALACLALAEKLEARWIAAGRLENEAAARRELDNWRAALRWTLRQQSHLSIGLRLAAALRCVWSRYGPAEGRTWIREALAAGTDTIACDFAPKLNLADAQLSMLLNEYRRALSSAQVAIGGFDTEACAEEIAEAQLYAGVALGLLGSTQESEDLLQAALATFQAAGLVYRIASALQGLAICRVSRGDLDGARTFFADALHAYEVSGAEASAAHMALNLAEAEFQAGNAERALKLAQRALASDRARHDDNGVVYDLCNASAYLLALGRPVEAVRDASEALALSTQCGISIGAYLAMQRLAASAALHPEHCGDAVKPQLTSTRLLGFVSARFNDLGYMREFTELREYDAALAALTLTLENDALETIMLEGQLWSDERAQKEAMTLFGHNATPTLR